MPQRPEVIVVDDDQGVRRSLQLLLRGHGYRVRAYADPKSVDRDPDAGSAALLVADYRMPGADGFDVLRGLRARGWMGDAVLMTGFSTQQLATAAIAEGFAAVFDKPVRSNLLLGAARAATGHR